MFVLLNARDDDDLLLEDINNNNNNNNNYNKNAAACVLFHGIYIYICETCVDLNAFNESNNYNNSKQAQPTKSDCQ